MAIRTPRSLNRLLAIATLIVLAACQGPVTTQQVNGLSVGIRTEPNPAELGENTFRFWVKQNGDALENAPVRFRMFMDGMPMNSDAHWTDTRHDGNGQYTGVGDFSMGGTWQVEVAVTTPGMGTTTLRFPYDIEWKLK